MFIIAFLVALVASVGIVRRATSDPAVQVLAIVLTIVLAIGTLFYWRVEEWSLLDSLYFSVVALTTVGLGDFAPETSAGKVFTIVYLISGVGLMMAFATAIVQRSRLWFRVEERLARKSVEDEIAEARSSSGSDGDDSSRGSDKA